MYDKILKLYPFVLPDNLDGRIFFIVLFSYTNRAYLCRILVISVTYSQFLSKLPRIVENHHILTEFVIFVLISSRSCHIMKDVVLCAHFQEFFPENWNGSKNQGCQMNTTVLRTLLLLMFLQ